MSGILEKINNYRDRKFNEGSYLVYSMGKVGSSSVEASLKKRLPNAVVFHTHFLSDFWLNEKLPKLNNFFHGNIHIGKKIRNYLDQNEGKKVRIITLVREPVIREMSGIFENWKAHFNDIEKANLAELTEKINGSDYYFCLNWFDSEFKAFTQFDIYSVTFDTERGYSIYKTGDFEILCIQLEKLGDVFSQAMKEFAGMKLELITANVGEEKAGSKLYNKLRKNYKLSEEKAELVYNSKYMKHFYSEKDISAFRNKWSK